MAVSVQHRGTGWQLRVTHRLLPQPFIHTFSAEAEAREYGAQLRTLLEQGVVPVELAERGPTAAAQRRADPLLVEVIRVYVQAAPVAPTDEALLGTMLPELAGVRASHVTYAWAEAYVRRLKTERNLAPGSIRKRVGSLARVIDWHQRRSAPAGAAPAGNALRLLPTGYSAYSRADAAAAQRVGGRARRDQARNRRLSPAEWGRIEAALAGVRREDRERALPGDADFALLVRLIVDTGLRLREAYTLRAEQVDLERGLLHVAGTKGHRGHVRPRTVPVVPALAALLRAHMGPADARIGRLLPSLWDGTDADLPRATRRLSARVRVLLDYAHVHDCTEHDLRHEATCRWLTLRRPDGAWALSDVEVCRIMGWTDPRMLLRYASWRGEDLAARVSGA